MWGFGLMSGFLAIGGFLVFLVFLALIGLYLLLAFGLYNLAEQEKIQPSWLSFLPIVQLYIAGRLIKSLRILDREIPYKEYVLPCAPIVYYILSNIFIIGFAVWLANVILLVAAMYYLFKRYKGEAAVLMTIISVILPFMGPVFIFGMRNLKPLDGE